MKLDEMCIGRAVLTSGAGVHKEIPRPAGENAGLRDDAPEIPKVDWEIKGTPCRFHPRSFDV
jgi:hypothetical protein